MEEKHDIEQTVRGSFPVYDRKSLVSRFTVGQRLLAVWLVGLMLGFSLGRFSDGLTISRRSSGASTSDADGTALLDKFAPASGVILSISWGDLGKKLVDSGVIDMKKFESLYAQRGGLSPEMSKMMTAADNGRLTFNRENAQVILNILWALGLGNKNEILEKGPMMEKQYNGAGNFASTGGWTLSVGKPMDHYSRHEFMSLTPEQQDLVARVAKNIYRPCCGNPTHFPDCNHGMAMLGLLELMASQGANEEEMYSAALTANTYWFPDTYATIGKYLATKGIALKNASPQELVGLEYASAQGYQQIQNSVEPVQGTGGGGCSA